MTQAFTILIKPAFDRRGKRLRNYYEVRLLGDREIICVSTQPLLDASRVLIKFGADPSAKISMAYERTPERIALRGVVGIAAQYDVMGSRFVRRKSMAGLMRGSPMNSWNRGASVQPSFDEALRERGITEKTRSK